MIGAALGVHPYVAEARGVVLGGVPVRKRRDSSQERRSYNAGRAPRFGASPARTRRPFRKNTLHSSPIASDDLHTDRKTVDVNPAWNRDRGLAD